MLKILGEKHEVSLAHVVFDIDVVPRAVVPMRNIRLLRRLLVFYHKQEPTKMAKDSRALQLSIVGDVFRSVVRQQVGRLAMRSDPLAHLFNYSLFRLQFLFELFQGSLELRNDQGIKVRR